MTALTTNHATLALFGLLLTAPLALALDPADPPADAGGVDASSGTTDAPSTELPADGAGADPDAASDASPPADEATTTDDAPEADADDSAAEGDGDAANAGDADEARDEEEEDEVEDAAEDEPCEGRAHATFPHPGKHRGFPDASARAPEDRQAFFAAVMAGAHPRAANHGDD